MLSVQGRPRRARAERGIGGITWVRTARWTSSHNQHLRRSLRYQLYSRGALIALITEPLPSPARAFDSPRFIAPEIFRDAPYTPAECDLFSLGCVLLELVVGHRPFMDWVAVYERDGVVGGAVWYGRARVGITTATDLHICALGGAAESARYSSAVRAF